MPASLIQTFMLDQFVLLHCWMVMATWLHHAIIILWSGSYHCQCTCQCQQTLLKVLWVWDCFYVCVCSSWYKQHIFSPFWIDTINLVLHLVNPSCIIHAISGFVYFGILWTSENIWSAQIIEVGVTLNCLQRSAHYVTQQTCNLETDFSWERRSTKCTT